jgi:hypothetical protein
MLLLLLLLMVMVVRRDLSMIATVHSSCGRCSNRSSDVSCRNSSRFVAAAVLRPFVC